MSDIGTSAQLLGLLVIAIAVGAVVRRVDVRLALFLAALALGALAGDVTPVVRTFLITLCSEQFVVPICTAMGFAHVLRHSGCDQHLVQLLSRPLRKVRVLLIPGSVLVGCVVNVSIISQASTTVAISTVLVPLLRAAGLSATTIGATLVLGASIGGELLNQGAPEMNTVANRVGVSAAECAARVLPLLAVQVAVALAVFWPLCLRAEARDATSRSDEKEETVPTFRVNLFKAAVPVIPLVLLMVVGPPFNLVRLPSSWLVVRDKDMAAAVSAVPEESRRAVDRALTDTEQQSYGSRLVGVSMLIGAALAAVAAPRRSGAAARMFFEGAGYALTNIISLIVIAQCFGTGIKQLHLDEPVKQLIGGNPDLVWPLSGGLTLAFAVVCGSGMAATQSLYAIFVTNTMGTELMLRVGALVSIAAAAGRTMSPVAAVTLTGASVTGSEALAISRRVAGPLLVATACTAAVAWWRGG